MSLQKGLRRSVLDELGIDVAVGRKLLSVEHGFTHFLATLHVYACRHLKGRPKALGCAGWSWVPVERLENLAFSKADRVTIRDLFETHEKT